MKAQSKLVQIRDEGTHIEALAFRLVAETSEDARALARCGYGTTPEQHKGYLFLMKLDGPAVQIDPFDWGRARTMNLAHQALDGRLAHLKFEPGSDYAKAFPKFDPIRAKQLDFDVIVSGQVLDVQWLVGERETVKERE